MTSKPAYIAIALVVLTIGLLVPFETSVVSAASVRFVDESGKPAHDILVKQEWNDVTVEDKLHVDFARTDKNGVAVFPARTVRSYLLKRVVNTIWRGLTQGIHASLGSGGTITGFANGDPYTWAWVGYERNGGSWPTQMQLQRWDSPAYP